MLEVVLMADAAGRRFFIYSGYTIHVLTYLQFAAQIFRAAAALRRNR
jgi:hypothetical protein